VRYSGAKKRRMEDIQQQLAALRRRIANIGRASDLPRPAERRDVRPRCSIEEFMSGEVVKTALGEHFETERVWERHRRHGSIDISDLAGLPDDLLESLSGGAVSRAHPGKWAFLDTETTGLAGGSGTYAFLIGVGSIDSTGFRLRQFFMRDYGEEPSLLRRLDEYLAQFDVLITYNGKAYDQPLLETRFRMSRARHPFDRLQHLDLLFGARRLWKLRLDSCRLVDLESQILGVEREGDLPGEMIPYCYFDFLRTKQAFKVVPIFHHNAIDILSLACLTAIVPFAYRRPEDAPLRHGPDLIGLARWLEKSGRDDEALRLFRRAVDLGLPDAILFRALWDISALERRAGRHDAALAVVAELAGCRNPYRARALEALAKHYEHRERNYAMALEFTRTALSLSESRSCRKREARLCQRMATSAARPRLS
jgi:uncharacterized protein YprB with RNaseH-like and TPR domain